jgi:hypothetical protein
MGRLTVALWYGSWLAFFGIGAAIMVAGAVTWLARSDDWLAVWAATVVWFLCVLLVFATTPDERGR